MTAYSDLELTYLLSAYGEQVFGLALANGKSEKEAEEIAQRIFLEVVLFPPALEEQALRAALLKKAAQQSGSKIKEAPPRAMPKEFEDELLALMKEARDHQGILLPPLKKWRKAHTIAAAAAAFLLLFGLVLALLFGGSGQSITDDRGSTDLLQPAPQQQLPPKEETPDPVPQQPDPLYPFEMRNDETCVTYTDLSAFAAAIGQHTAPGYGDCYYTAQALLLLPSRLPDDARFRCLYLDPTSGNYSYSFQFEYQKTLFLLDFSVTQSLPASALEMENAIKAIRTEKQTAAIKGTTLLATFGKDQISATLSAPESQEPLDEALAKKLLQQITLERCSQENPFL